MAAEKVGSIYYDLDLDDKKFKKGMSSAKKDVSSLGDNFKAAEAGSMALAGALAAVGAGLIAIGLSSVKAFTESQNVMAQTEAVIKSTGGAAKLSAHEVSALAKGFQDMTTFSDEAVQSGENILLTFTNIGKDTFPQATATMLDMSQALGQDVKSSAIQLGKALQDPIQGITALRRVGVNFNDAQQETINKLVKSGKTMEAQKLILKELQTEFGGSANAAGETFAGKLALLNNQLNDVQEEIGALIVNALTPVIDSFSEWFTDIGGLNGIIQQATTFINNNQAALYILAGAITFALIPAFVAMGISIWSALAPLLPFIAIGALVGFAIYKLVEAFGGWDNLLAQVQNTLMEVWKVVEPILKPALDELKAVVADQLMPALTDLWNLISPSLIPILKVLATIIGAILVAAIWVGIHTWTLIISALTLGVNIIKGAIQNVVNFVNLLIAVFTGTPDQIKEALKNVGDGIIKPFKDAFDWITKEVQKVKDSLDKLNPYHRESPSLVDWVTKGTGQITGLYDDMFNDINSMTSQSRGALLGASQGLSNSVNSQQGNTSIANAPVTVVANLSGIVARSRSDLREIGADIIGAVNEDLRSRGVEEIGGGNILAG